MKNLICVENGFTFSEEVKLTMKNDSNLSIKNVCYYLKFTLPIMYRPFFRTISQNPEDVKIVCNDLNSSFFHVSLMEN